MNYNHLHEAEDRRTSSQPSGGSVFPSSLQGSANIEDYDHFLMGVAARSRALDSDGF